jgi:hypothetical protein
MWKFITYNGCQAMTKAHMTFGQVSYKRLSSASTPQNHYNLTWWAKTNKCCGNLSDRTSLIQQAHFEFTQKLCVPCMDFCHNGIQSYQYISPKFHEVLQGHLSCVGDKTRTGLTSHSRFLVVHCLLYHWK